MADNVSIHNCHACGREFTLCPPADSDWTECLADDCITYDPDRDLDIRFGFKDPPRMDH